MTGDGASPDRRGRGLSDDSIADGERNLVAGPEASISFSSEQRCSVTKTALRTAMASRKVSGMGGGETASGLAASGLAGCR